GTAPCGSSYGTFQSLPSGWVVACLVTHSGFWIVELSQKITGELIRVSSKRHRIVEINAELLKNRKNITLNFFEDIAIPLKLETIKDGRGSLTWLGQMQFG